MKRNLLFPILSLLLMCNATFATKSPPIGLKKPTFSSVHWHATMSNGGFSLENQTNKIQYVQVTIETGEIAVITSTGQDLGKCRKNLDALSGPTSIVCELAPNDRLSGDLDFSRMAEATGTYQVEMDQ
jgi:hypothetical protein